MAIFPRRKSRTICFFLSRCRHIAWDSFTFCIDPWSDDNPLKAAWRMSSGRGFNRRAGLAENGCRSSLHFRAFRESQKLQVIETSKVIDLAQEKLKLRLRMRVNSDLENGIATNGASTRVKAGRSARRQSPPINLGRRGFQLAEK